MAIARRLEEESAKALRAYADQLLTRGREIGAEIDRVQASARKFDDLLKSSPEEHPPAGSRLVTDAYLSRAIARLDCRGASKIWATGILQQALKDDVDLLADPSRRLWASGGRLLTERNRAELPAKVSSWVSEELSQALEEVVDLQKSMIERLHDLHMPSGGAELHAEAGAPAMPKDDPAHLARLQTANPGADIVACCSYPSSSTLEPLGAALLEDGRRLPYRGETLVGTVNGKRIRDCDSLFLAPDDWLAGVVTLEGGRTCLFKGDTLVENFFFKPVVNCDIHSTAGGIPVGAMEVESGRWLPFRAAELFEIVDPKAGSLYRARRYRPRQDTLMGAVAGNEILSCASIRANERGLLFGTVRLVDGRTVSFEGNTLLEESGAKRRKAEAPPVPAPPSAAEALAPGRATFPEEILEIEGRRVAVAKRPLCWQSQEDLAALREHVGIPGMTWERFFGEFGWQAFSGPSGRWLGNDKLVPYIDSSGEKNTLFCVSYDLAPSLIGGAKLWGGADCDLLGVRPIDYAGREFALYVQKGNKVYSQSFRLPAEFRTERQLLTRHAMVESLPEVLAWACRHLQGSSIADLPPPQAGHAPPPYNLRARELLDPRGLSLRVVIGERPLQLALAAAARDPVEQEILAELLRQRKPAQMQSARDLSPDVLLAYQEQRKPEVAARNLAYIPSSIPYFDITEVLIPRFSLQGRTAQELQERAYREGKLILGVRPLCWETGDFVLFLHDLRNAKILLQPFSLTKDSPRNRERIAGRLQAVVPEVVRTVLQPEPPPAGAADGVEPVPAARFRR